MVMSIEQCVAQLGSAFEVQTQHGVLALTLVEATERPRRGLPPRFCAPVSLVFQGPAHLVLAQDVYPMSHPVLGDWHWTLVQVAPYSVPGYEDSALPLYEVMLIQSVPPQAPALSPAAGAPA
jgi:hypothetical protein